MIPEPFVKGWLQWSRDGSKILFVGHYASPVDVISADGSRLEGIKDVPGDLVSDYAGSWRTFDLSVDGSRIAYSTCGYGEDYEIVVANIDGTDTRKLSPNISQDLYPAWSPDGTRLAFIRVLPPGWRSVLIIHPVAPGKSVQVGISNTGLFQRPAGKSQSVTRHPPVWSPDGQSIAFLGDSTDISDWGTRITKLHVYMVGSDGSGLRRIVSNVVSAPSWSPDNERIAVAVSEGDGATLYTFATDGSDPVMVTRVDAKDIVARSGESDPAALWVPNVSWSLDGSKIMYGALSVKNVEDGSVVLDTQLIRFEWVGNYGTRVVSYIDEDARTFPVAAWSPDGSRIAVLAAAELHLWGNDPLLYTMNSDGTDPRILVATWSGGLTIWPAPIRSPADVEACSKDIIVPNPEQNPGLVEDCRTLLVMRDKLVGSGSGMIPWSSDTPITEWGWIEVSGEPHRVRALYISDYASAGKLYGQVPSEIGNLVGLRELIIGDTHVNGRIPREIGRLANLESLEVAFTHMGGSIPAEIGNLTNLKRLVLRDSQFSGSIPEETGKLVNLEVMDLQNNIISGHIPPEIGNLTNLRNLNLGGVLGNELTGSIPTELGNLINLTHLVLGCNKLSGSIPQALRDQALRDLRNLQYSDHLLAWCQQR